MAFELPKLPYSQDALEPHISSKTMSFHYGKHHQAYVTKINELTKDTPMAKHSLEQIMRDTANDAAKAALFNNAAQVWNHTFFWNCLTPNGGTGPSGELAERVKEAFGGVDKLKEELKNAAVGQFGSGWAWLVVDGGKLKVVKTANAMSPVVQNQTALLTIDVWEHAYYLDYQNRRPDFVQTVLDKLVNWDFVAENLKSR
ncbi:MAG: superoxide dismutase [Myxococcota bacterium]